MMSYLGVAVLLTPLSILANLKFTFTNATPFPIIIHAQDDKGNAWWFNAGDGPSYNLTKNESVSGSITHDSSESLVNFTVYALDDSGQTKACYIEEHYYDANSQLLAAKGGFSWKSVVEAGIAIATSGAEQAQNANARGLSSFLPYYTSYGDYYCDNQMQGPFTSPSGFSVLVKYQ